MTSKSPTANPTITPSPSHPGSLIRKVFLAEALLNLFTIPLLTHPDKVLSLFLLRPPQITPATVLFARLFGGIVVGGLTSALLAGATNTRNGIESRRPVYLMLGMGEGLLIPILVAEATKKGGSGAALSVKVSVVAIGMLVMPLVWRCYVLFVRPDFFGRYTEKKEEQSGRGVDYGTIASNRE